MFKTNCPIHIVTRAPRGQLIHIQAKDVFMEHLHGNNMKKDCAFTMQHLLILNILWFILMLLDACFSFWNPHITIEILTEKLIIISSCAQGKSHKADL